LSVILTQEQEDTINGIQIIQGLNANFFATLSGPAGTGKTFTVNQIKGILKGSYICLAPTHTAAKLIGGQTIHSFFSMRPKDPDAPVIEFENALRPKVIPDTIILDECSMVSDYLVQLILNWCKNANVNMLCVGDEYQLPPVGSNQPNCCFDPNYFNQWPLTKIMRQSANSPIIGLSSLFRQYKYIPNWDLAKNKGPQIIADFWGNNWCDYYDPYDLNHSITGFTNEAVASMNRKINRATHDDGLLFHAGDTIVLKQPVWYKDGEYYDEYDKEMKPQLNILTTGTEVILKDAKKSFVLVKDMKLNTHRLECYMIELDLGTDDPVIKYLLDYDSWSAYDSIKKTYVRAFKSATTGKEYITEMWKQSGMKRIVRAYHRYASTVHLTQGKTHTKTFFMKTTLYGLEQKQDIELYNRLSYVACTRPTTQLIITGAIYK
jgi:hypothetical protein